MKNTVKKIITLTITVGALLLSTSSKAQLGVGDSSPELKYAKWIKGTPITSYKANHLYVFEFWATWCGPCKAAMPHLSQLARTFKDKVTFVGVNIWENTQGKPYESSLPAVTKFVSGMGKNMDYDVVADNNDQHMANKWMVASGQGGIPSTFLVLNSKIIWIGHPNELDQIIPEVLVGSFKMEPKKKMPKPDAENTVPARKKDPTPLEIAYKLYQENKYAESWSILDTLHTRTQREGLSKKYMQFGILVKTKKSEEALNFGKEWLKETPMMNNEVAGIILENEGLSKEVYLYAVERYRPLLTQKNVAFPTIHHAMATLYAKAGDFKSAVEYEEMAITGAKQALKDGLFIGTILEYTPEEYEEQLNKYKKQQR